MQTSQLPTATLPLEDAEQPKSIEEMASQPLIIEPLPCNPSAIEPLVEGVPTPPAPFPPAELHRRLPKMKLKELQEYAKMLKISSVGTKVELVERIACFSQKSAESRFVSVPSVFNREAFGGIKKRKKASEFVAQSAIIFNITKKSQCICNDMGSKESQPTLKCEKCGSFQHKECVGKNSSLRPYECPLCLISKLDPLVPVVSKSALIDPLLTPITCSDSTLFPLVYESIFNVTSKQLDSNNGRRIYIRCIRLDGKSSVHTWPIYGQILLNGKQIETFHIPKGPLPAKRKDQPKQLTREDLLEGGNRLRFIRLADSEGLTETETKALGEDLQHVYAFAVVETEALEPEALIRRVCAQNRPTVEESRERFMAQLKKQLDNSSDEDCMCEDNDIELSCSDPYLPGTLMNIPVYSKRCKHLASFDLERYVRMNQKMRLWKCPHCFEKALDLVVDSYFEQLLVAIRPLNLSLPKIQVDKNGVFTIDGKISIKYMDGKFLFTKDEAKENFRVKITLPKEINKSKADSCKSRNTPRSNSEFVMMPEEQSFPFFSVPQLAFFQGIPSLSFDQIAKRGKLDGFGDSSTIVTIPKVVQPNTAPMDGIERSRLLESDKLPCTPKSTPKASDAIGKLLVAQISFNSRGVKKAKEGQKRDMGQTLQDLRRIRNDARRRARQCKDEAVISYPDPSRDAEKLSKRAKKWKRFSDYFKSMGNDPIFYKANRTYNTGSKRRLEEMLQHQREVVAKTHLAFKEPARTRELNSLPMNLSNNQAFIPQSVNPYQILGYCASPDASMAGYEVGRAGGYFDQQLYYGQTCSVPGKLLGHPQAGKIVYAPCVYLPNNHPSN